MAPIPPNLFQTESFDSSSSGSTSSGCRTCPSSKPNSAKDVKGIARNALRAYAQIPSIGPETPSVESIIAAYERDGHGDRALLIAILEAKKMEDERLATRDKLELKRLHAQNHRWPGPGMATGHLVTSEEVVSKPVLTSSSRVESQTAWGRKLSLSSSSSLSYQPSPRTNKRARESLEVPLTHEKIARETVKMALEAKIARSKQARPDQRPATSSASLPHDQMSLRPGLASLGTTWKPPNARSSSRPASVGTQDCSVSSLEARSNPPSPPFPAALEPATLLCTEDSPVNSRPSSSLAHLLNDPVVPSSRLGS